MTRKCTIEGCPSKSGNPQHRGVTFHAFPFDSKTREIWIANCRLSPEKNITKNVLVCSRHFRRVDFQPAKSNKFLLKQGSVPTIFPWGKVESDEQTTDSNSNLSEQCRNTNTMEASENLPENEMSGFQTPTKRSYESENDELPTSKIPKLSELNYEDSALETSPILDSNLETEKSCLLSSPEIVSHQRKNEPTSPGFTLGVKIEAQDFNGIWHTAKVVEVDSDEREVLIRFEKSRKNKGGGGAEEWIPMNSSRLRHIASQSIKKPPPIFEIGEKCTARWSGPRRFPATVTKVLSNDTYEVLFDDGYMKVVKGHHMGKIKQKSVPPKSPTTVTKPKSPKKDWPLISISSLNLEELDLPDIPKDGEWCCHWVNDQPIGQEGFLMVGDHKKPTVIVEDWRLPPNWVKHMYQRSNVLGKWDVILVNPQGKRFRSKADLKQYIEELGQVYNPDVYDFSIHRRRAKDIGAYVYTKDYKPPPPPISSSQQFFATQSQNTSTNITLPTITTPLMSPTLPEPPSTLLDEDNLTPIKSTEEEKPFEDGYVYVGSLKVQIIDNLFRCPQEGCNKNFRKENHLQIHVKHYHRELAKLLGVCPNMQELACKRTIGTISEEPLPKNHLPNVQFFAKLHQQDLASKIHRKSTATPTSAFSSLASPSSHDDIQTVGNSTRKDNLETSVTTQIAEINQNSNATESLLTSTPNNKPFSHSSSSFLSDQIPHATGDSTPPILQNQEQKSTGTSKLKKLINKNSSTSSNRKSSRQKLAKKYIQSNILSSGGAGDASFGVSDQEETRHSFNGGNNSMETTTATTIKSSKKPKPEPLFLVSDANLDATSQSQTTGSIQENSQSPKYINENGEIIKIVRMRQEEIINCLCSYGEEDGLMIQCELCLCWQHGICNGIEKESQVPEKYICYICRNPQRGRSSLKYIHDQDWMYEGKLPVANYHAPSPDLEERFEILRKTHILTGNLLELKRFMHSLKVKINIAENKDHPKMYLWTNKWESSPSKDVTKSSESGKLPSSDNVKIKEDEDKQEETNIQESNTNNVDTENELKEEKPDINSDEKENAEKMQSDDISQSEVPQVEVIKQPTIPQPEAPIDPVECQRRLLEHIKNQQLSVMDRLQTIESQILELESLDDSEVVNDPNDYSKTKDIIAMYIKDLEIMKNISKINTVQV